MTLPLTLTVFLGSRPRCSACWFYPERDWSVSKHDSRVPVLSRASRPDGTCLSDEAQLYSRTAGVEWRMWPSAWEGQLVGAESSLSPCRRALTQRCPPQDSGGEDERQPGLLAVMKPSPKPRRARLIAKRSKLGSRKRGRPKKTAAAAAAERKSKKSQSALDLLHAKTLSAAPPQGGRPSLAIPISSPLCNIPDVNDLLRCSCSYRCI